MIRASIQNKNGYVFHRTQNWESETLAVMAAIRIAKRNKITIDEKNFFVCIDGSCNGVTPKESINISDYV